MVDDFTQLKTLGYNYGILESVALAEGHIHRLVG